MAVTFELTVTSIVLLSAAAKLSLPANETAMVVVPSFKADIDPTIITGVYSARTGRVPLFHQKEFMQNQPVSYLYICTSTPREDAYKLGDDNIIIMYFYVPGKKVVMAWDDKEISNKLLKASCRYLEQFLN